LYELSLAEKDYPSQSFLQWFIDEQVEEEQNAGDAVANLKMVGDNPYAILMLDRELGQRQPPVEANAE
ncbi:MAG: ferritin-like domain-containing protein, partial [Chloroflexota bacterium]|nr:ferritin-like domain-containing protein [Chloroflexota bacterium]